MAKAFDNVPKTVPFYTAFLAVLDATLPNWPALQAVCGHQEGDDPDAYPFTPEGMREQWDALITEVAARLRVHNLSVEDQGELMDFAADALPGIGRYLEDTTE